MTRPLKPLWREGLFLSQQHFQSWDRYHESLTYSNYRSLLTYYWGLREFEVDSEGLGNGKFGVKRIDAVMRDGTVLHAPEIDDTPSTREFAGLFGADKRFLTVHLTIPQESRYRPAVALSDTELRERTRFARVNQAVDDFVVGTNARTVEFVSKRFEFRFDGENFDSLESLPIARIIRKDANRYGLSADFAPPSLSLRAAEFWRNLYDELLRLVNLRTSDLGGNFHVGPDNTVALQFADLTNFLMLRELASVLPILLEFQRNPMIHPYEAYLALEQLVARLAPIFSLLAPNAAETFPPYNHESPSDGAIALKQLALKMIQGAVRRQPTRIDLVPVEGSDGMWDTVPNSFRLTGGETLYLITESSLSDDEFVRSFMDDCKIATPSRLDHLIEFGLPGLALERQLNMPMQLPALPRGLCFALQKHDQIWREISSSSSLRLFVPVAKYPGLRLELHCLK